MQCHVDSYVYLKLAYLYEDLATQEWNASFENAQKCYEYYLDRVDPTDTDVMVRLGNLILRGHQPSEALVVYGRALSIDPNLHSAWFNSACALIKLGGFAGAVEALNKALEGDPNNVAAKHMLAVSLFLSRSYRAFL